jgi:hypothetical protein
MVTATDRFWGLSTLLWVLLRPKICWIQSLSCLMLDQPSTHKQDAILAKKSSQMASCWRKSLVFSCQSKPGTEGTGSIQYSMWAWPDIQWAQRLFNRTRLKEYLWHIWLEYPDKSEMAKHSSNLGHHVQLHNTILVSASHWVYYKHKVLWYHQHDYLTFDTFYFALHPSTLIIGSSWKGKILKNISLFNCHA